MNIIHNIVVKSYNCLKLNTKAIIKEVKELLKDNYFIFSGLVSTLLFTIPDELRLG